MKVCLLARHGESEWNREGRRQGQLDAPVTVAALSSVRTLASQVAKMPVDSVFSSPLGRAVATASIYAEALSLPVEVVDQLREIDHGAMAGLTNGEIEERFPGELARRSRSRYTWRFPGGESYADADQRAALALEIVEGRGAEMPLVVAHEMIGRMLLRHLLGIGPEEALALSHPHGTVYQVDVAGHTVVPLRVDVSS
jgi:broad specificity phosphatase PhoE